MNKILFLGVLFTTALQAQPSLEYTLRFPEPWTQYAEVTLSMSGLRGSSTELAMAAWTPGSYAIRDYAGQVEGLQAFGPGSEALPIQKMDKQTWKLEHGKAGSFSVRYRVWCGELSVRQPYVCADFAALVPAGLLLFPKDLDLPVTLRVQPWEGWKVISTGLEPEADDPWVLSAPNRDHLLDAPLHIGNQQVLRFEAAGVKHELAIEGQGNYDTAALVRDLSLITEQSTELFGHNPNQRFVYLLINTDNSYGGLEHLNSTSMVYRRWGYQTRDRYLTFLGLASHEYLHLWNGKRLRPVELGPFDYSRENYTSLLWVVEGTTSYYDDLLLRRCGLMTEEEYLRVAAYNINSMLNREGDAVQSVAESSFDAWIKYYRSTPNSANSTVNYYGKGAVLSMVLDLEILLQSRGERRLDDVMRELYARYRANPARGYTERELQDLLEQVAGVSLDSFFLHYVHGTRALDLSPWLDRIGVDLLPGSGQDESLALGLSLGEGNSVRRVLRDSPAWRAGLQPGDELLGIGGYRYRDNLQDLLSTSKPGDSISVLLNRDGQLLERWLVPELLQSSRLVLKPRSGATEEQKRLYRLWLSL
jgi:predicted metalloprotease with PDZ domain